MRSSATRPTEVGSGDQRRLTNDRSTLIALYHGPMCVGALFGVLRAGVVVVMVNPELPHRPGSALAGELQEFVRAHLEYFKCPREIAFLEDLPRTHLNKVDRNGLARWMATGLKTGGPTK